MAEELNMKHLSLSFIVTLLLLSFSLQAQFKEVLRHQSSRLDGDYSSSIYFSALETDTGAYITINTRFYWTQIGLFKKGKTSTWQHADPLNVYNIKMSAPSFISKNTLFNLQGYGSSYLGDSIGLCKYNNTSWIPASKRIPSIKEFRNADIICVNDTFYVIYKIDYINYLQKLVGLEWQTIASFIDSSYCTKTKLIMEKDTFYISTIKDGSRTLSVRKIHNGTTTNLNFTGEPVHENCEVAMKMYNGKLILCYSKGRTIYDRGMEFWTYSNQQWAKSTSIITPSTVDFISYTYDFMYKNGDLYFVYPTSNEVKVTIALNKYQESTNEWLFTTSATQKLLSNFDLRTIRVVNDQIYFSVADDYLTKEIIIYGYEELGNTSQTFIDKCQSDSVLLTLDYIMPQDSIIWLKDNHKLSKSASISGVTNATLKLYNSDKSGIYKAVIKRNHTIGAITDTTASFTVNMHNPMEVPVIKDQYLHYGLSGNIYIPLNNSIKKAQWYKGNVLSYTDSTNTDCLCYDMGIFEEKYAGTYKILLSDFCNNQVYTNSFKLINADNVSTTFKIYPNPTTGYINIRNNKDILISSIDIYNSWGELVHNIGECYSGIIQLNQFGKGVFFLRIFLVNGEHTTERVAVE